ncbi:MAG: putative porin [Candidatus Coatesbacteria bacterium]
MKKIMVAAAALMACLPLNAAAAPDLPEVKPSTQVDTLTIGGDIRIREEYYDYRDDPSSTRFVAGKVPKDRNRIRYRLRMKLDYKLKDDLKAVASLASGTGEAVSTNQTLSGLGRQKAIWIDQAYISWSPALLGDAGTIALSAGRMANPLWRLYSSDIVWDGDFNPEGFGESLSYVVGDSLRVFANGMQMVDDEWSANGNDPWTLSEQVGFEMPLPAASRLIVAGAFHKWLHVNDGQLNQSPVQLGNTRASSTLMDGYGVAELTAQVSTWIPVPMTGISLPFAVAGTVIANREARDPAWSGTKAGHALPPGSFIGRSAGGYQIGAQLGKASAPGTWEVAYYYKRAAWDCTVADVADSDFGDGGLDRKGNIAWIAYTPNGFVTFQAKVFNVRLLDKRYVMTGAKINVPDRINRIQVDATVKF